MPSRTGHRAEGKVELQGEELTELITILRQSIALNK